MRQYIKALTRVSYEMMTFSDSAVLHGKIEFLHEVLLVEHVPHLQHYKEL